MCQIFSSQSPERWKSETRSIRLRGHSTSIRLEAAFWQTLENIAYSQVVTVPQLLTQLYDEVLDIQGEVGNFTSLLRCACLTYVGAVEGVTDDVLIAEAKQQFQPGPMPAE